ncbi:hypothetical protein CCYA_CCYA19G4629 [Cyanidiococcus yangmingshanensis]|nr:hypothetical protein CCYA_CCYA19G4629 [Cyanidiococcus yangmingshanensis]
MSWYVVSRALTVPAAAAAAAGSAALAPARAVLSETRLGAALDLMRRRGANSYRSASSSSSSAVPRPPNSGASSRRPKDWGWKPRAVPAAVAEELVNLHNKDPNQWSADTLSRKYGYDRRFVEAVLELAAAEPAMRAQVGEKQWNELARAWQEFEALVRARAGPQHLVLGIPAPWEEASKLRSQHMGPREIFYRPRPGERTDAAEARAVREHFGGKERITVSVPVSGDTPSDDSPSTTTSSAASLEATSQLPEWCSTGGDTTRVSKPRVPFVFVDRDTSTSSVTGKGSSASLQVIVRDTDGVRRAPRPEERNFALAMFGYGESQKARRYRRRFRRVQVSLEGPSQDTQGHLSAPSAPQP